MSNLVNKEFFEPVKTNYLAVGLKEADFTREVSFAIQHINKNPLLLKCTSESLLKSVVNLAQVGLTLNPISKYAYLIPRWNKDTKGFECVLEPDYRGLQKLLTDTGAVKSIEARIIWEGDNAEVDFSDERKIVKHEPYLLTGKVRGKIRGVYSLAKLADDSRHIEMMSYDDVCEIRDRSESYKAFKEGKIKSCIWVSDEPEMCRKTIIKRHYKYLPKSAGMEKLEKAIELDNHANGFDEPMEWGMITYIDQLLRESSLDESTKKKLENRLHSAEFKSQGFKLIEELQDSQPVYGRDKYPVSTQQINSAARYAADMDDFKEKK